MKRVMEKCASCQHLHVLTQAMTELNIIVYCVTAFIRMLRGNPALQGKDG